MHHNPAGSLPHSQLFSVRVWQEAMGGDVYETRSRVHHVLSGEVCYFRQWADLVAYLQDKVECQSGSVSETQSIDGANAPLVQDSSVQG
jgi:hypothetical protein